jgi:hypothetical protein
MIHGTADCGPEEGFLNQMVDNGDPHAYGRCQPIG